MIRAIVVVCAASIANALLLGAQTTQPAQEEKSTTPGGVTVIKIRAPDGARDGDLVWVHYTGTFEDGTQFDSSHQHNPPEPIAITLGSRQVIRGWEEGLQGMQVGEKRKLIIPPDMAYGAEGRPPKIPANATLIFEVELMGLQRK